MTHSNSSKISNIITPLSSIGQPHQLNVNPPVRSDELLTLAEVAIYLKLSRRTTWRWCKSGQLPAIKVGHQWRVARSDLENFVMRRRMIP